MGRNEEKTINMAKDIATARSGAKVIGIGKVDVRKPEVLQAAVDQCVKELGGIDFAMYVSTPHPQACGADVQIDELTPPQAPAQQATSSPP